VGGGRHASGREPAEPRSCIERVQSGAGCRLGAALQQSCRRREALPSAPPLLLPPAHG
jgi:hypothetical protein